MRLLACAIGLLASTGALAQSDADKATARALGERAHAALTASDYATAADLFARAEALVAAPTLTLGLARAQVGLGKLVAAHESYQRVIRWDLGTRPPKAFSAAVEAARGEVLAVSRRLPSIVIKPAGPERPEVRVDGELVPPAALGVPRFVDPGRHVVSATAPGFRAATVEVDAQEGQSQALELRLERAPVALTGSTARKPAGPPPDTIIHEPARSLAPAPRGSAMTTAGQVMVGAGIGGVTAGLATGGLALARRPGPGATPTQTDAYRRLRNLAAGSLVGGGALLAGGLATAWTDDAHRGARHRLGLALVGAGVAGLAVGAAAAGMNRSVTSHLRSACPDDVCPGFERPNAESARHLGVVSIGSFAVGAASLGTGTALLLTEGGDGRALAIGLAPSGLSVGGTW